jgi:hypothetical protein
MRIERTFNKENDRLTVPKIVPYYQRTRDKEKKKNGQSRSVFHRARSSLRATR